MSCNITDTVKNKFAKLFINKKRQAIAKKYIRGNGIEIGALHNPLKISGSAKVVYIDRMPPENLRRHYPELKAKKFVNVDIIDNGERLDSIKDFTQDFVIANHFIEHCRDPIGAIGNMFRVLKNDGILYLSIPDKRYSFDKDRLSTPIEHILKDYEEGPLRTDKEHFEEWVKIVNKIEDDAEAEKEIKRLMTEDYSIHYHTWTQSEAMEFMLALKERLRFKFGIELFCKNAIEVIFILRKYS